MKANRGMAGDAASQQTLLGRFRLLFRDEVVSGDEVEPFATAELNDERSEHDRATAADDERYDQFSVHSHLRSPDRSRGLS